MSSLAPDQRACERQAGPRAILDIGLLCDRDGLRKQRAQAGEAMAGGAADWNEGVPVGGGLVARRCAFEPGLVVSQFHDSSNHL